MCLRSESDRTYPEVQHVRLLVALDIHEYLYNYSALFSSMHHCLCFKFNDVFSKTITHSEENDLATKNFLNL